VIVNKAFNGREIKVRAGAMIQVELQQLGAAGYAWEIQGLDAEHFKVQSVKTEDRKDSGDIVGAPILKTWRIGAIKAGKSKLRFLHYRPWEGEESAVDTFVLNVRIIGTK
jgi:predicted secreted protein